MLAALPFSSAVPSMSPLPNPPTLPPVLPSWLCGRPRFTNEFTIHSTSTFLSIHLLTHTPVPLVPPHPLQPQEPVLRLKPNCKKNGIFPQPEYHQPPPPPRPPSPIRRARAIRKYHSSLSMCRRQCTAPRLKRPSVVSTISPT